MKNLSDPVRSPVLARRSSPPVARRSWDCCGRWPAGPPCWIISVGSAGRQTVASSGRQLR